MIAHNKTEYTKLEDLPSLKEGWVRLVHRCIYKDHVDSIRKNGLVFNRSAAKLSPLQKGASYSDITSMASVYNESSFWKSIRKDDFYCYDNAKYADTKIVFDMPLDEFCLLERYGRIIKGKVDSKYIIGTIPNVNGANKSLQTSHEEIDTAEKISRNNPSSSVEANNVETIIDELLANSNSDKKEELRNRVYKNMQRCKKDLEFAFNSEQSKKNVPLGVICKNYNRTR